jgi:hypothetical protein
MVRVLYVTPVPPGARFPEKRAARRERQRAVLVSYADRPGIAGDGRSDISLLGRHPGIDSATAQHTH